MGAVLTACLGCEVPEGPSCPQGTGPCLNMSTGQEGDAAGV